MEPPGGRFIRVLLGDGTARRELGRDGFEGEEEGEEVAALQK